MAERRAAMWWALVSGAAIAPISTGQWSSGELIEQARALAAAAESAEVAEPGSPSLLDSSGEEALGGNQPPLAQDSLGEEAAEPAGLTRPSDALPLGNAERESVLSFGGDASDAATGNTGWLRMTGSLIAVLAIIGVMWWMVRATAKGRGGIRNDLGAGGRAPSGVVSVLGRYPIARGHSLVLMKLDRRVLVLDQTTSGFKLLTEVNDPEEVASILVKTSDDEGTSMSRRFEGMLRSFERDPELVEASSGLGSVRKAMSGEDEDERAVAAAEFEKHARRLRDGVIA